MLQSINREKLVPLSLDQYFSYGLAESSKVNLSSVIRTLTKFMETRGIEDYVQRRTRIFPWQTSTDHA